VSVGTYERILVELTVYLNVHNNYGIGTVVASLLVRN